MTASSFGTSGSQGPTLMSAGNTQLGAYVDASNAMWTVMFNRTTRAVSSGPYNMASIAGNPLSLPLDLGDGHEAPSVALDSTGRAWATGNNYNDVVPKLVRATSAGQVTSWTDVSSQLPAPTDAFHGYYNFLRFSDGALMLLTRHRLNQPGSGDDPGGERCLYLAPAADTFTDLGYVLRGADATEDAFYRNLAYVDRNDRVHLMGAWDHEYDAGQEVDGLSYLYSDDRGVTWRDRAGSALTLPASSTNAAGVAIRTGISYDSDQLNQYGSGFALDASGHPCGIYSKQGGNQRVIRWNGSAWTVDTTAGSYYIGGTNVNLVNYRNDLWSLQRTGTFVEMRRHDGSVHEVARLGGLVGANWFCHPDPVALLAYDTVEVLIADPNPVVHTFGNGYRGYGVLMDELLLLAEGGNLLLTDGDDLLLASSEPEPPVEAGYYIEGRRLIRVEA